MRSRVFTDGSCSGNPGPGGWAWIIPNGSFAAGYSPDTTNQRMELTAAIKALEYFAEKDGSQPSLKQIKVYTDSTYVKEGITVWINNWEKNRMYKRSS